LKPITLVLEPMGSSLRVARGSSILQAALKAGIAVGSECGGTGKCGKCRVIVKRGSSVSPVSEVERRLLSDEELAGGIRLACQTLVLGDASVYLAGPTLHGLRRVQLEAVGRAVPLDPAVRKTAVCLPPPSLADARSDLQRVTDALQGSSEPCTVNLELLSNLPTILRDASWHVTCTVWNGQRLLDIESGDTTRNSYGVAVDIGTSKVAVQLVDLTSGRTIATRGSANPQLAFGEDVVDRIRVCSESGMLETLRHLVVDEIDKLLKGILKEASVPPANVYEMVVVGNTVMHHIFLGIPPRFVAVSPFTPVLTTPLDVDASRIGVTLNPRGVVHLPPNIAGFVGADGLADLVASGILESKKLTLLLDIGTNTEVFLGNDRGVAACSCASGPAFEGAHIKHGMKAVEGAIERVSLGQNASSLKYVTIGGGAPRGMCGSAVIDLVAGLFKHGALNSRGGFNADLRCDRLRTKGNTTEFVVARGQETATGKDIVLTQGDVSEILLAKAAVFTGCSLLMRNRHIAVNQIEEIAIGGAFGSYLNPRSALAIGMLPGVSPERISLRGNLALLGAKILLVSRAHRQMEADIRSKVEYVELTADPAFKSEFADALFLPHRTPK
jgi:uncharacterized 2Fe-2S/4Fe-4S cluster protein (DUF4445 family)